MLIKINDKFDNAIFIESRNIIEIVANKDAFSNKPWCIWLTGNRYYLISEKELEEIKNAK